MVRMESFVLTGTHDNCAQAIPTDKVITEENQPSTVTL